MGGAVPQALLAELQRMHAEGVRNYGPLALPFERFAGRAADRLRARCADADGDPAALIDRCKSVVAADHADLFSDFTPLDSTALLAPVRTLRGGEDVTLVAPMAVILEERPEFRWEPVEGAASYTVTLRQGDGSPLWHATSKEPRLAWPAGQAKLERGTTWSWQLEVDEPSGSSAAYRKFSVATQQQRDRFDAQKRAIAEIDDAELRPLLLAHVALSADLLREAEIAAMNFVSMHPDDLVGLETLFCVEKVIASPKAEALRELIESRRAK